MENKKNGLILSDDNLSSQVTSFKQTNDVVKKVLEKDVDFGIIPGTVKPTLYKSGAEKLCRWFKIHVEYKIEAEKLTGDHMGYTVDAVVKDNQTDYIIGEGTGYCTTMESKYRYRKTSRTCPVCGKETIIKGRKEYGGGWLCYAKKGGCNSKFPEGSSEIENQTEGYVEHENPADYYNTCRKMAKKRAYVDATITVLGLDMSQDLETVLENAFKLSESKGEKAGPFKEVEEALRGAGITRKQFSAWLKAMFGNDIDTVKVLTESKEQILKSIKEDAESIILSEGV
jgi:hypothetical protein